MTEKRSESYLFNDVEIDGDLITNSSVVATGTNLHVGPSINRPADGTPTLTKVPAPSTSTTGVSMTEAELLGGVHVKSPVAAQDFQLPTGAEISAAILAVHPGFAVGDSFDFHLVNTGTATDLVTLTTDTGLTLVGYMGVHPAADGATLGTSAGHFRLRNTGADAWTVHRIA